MYVVYELHKRSVPVPSTSCFGRSVMKLIYDIHCPHILCTPVLLINGTPRTIHTCYVRSIHRSRSFFRTDITQSLPFTTNDFVQSFNRSRSFFHTDITQSLLFTTNDFVQSFNRSRSSFRTHTPRRGVRHMYVLCMSVAVAPCAGASDISLIKDLSRLPPRVDLDYMLCIVQF